MPDEHFLNRTWIIFLLDFLRDLSNLLFHCDIVFSIPWENTEPSEVMVPGLEDVRRVPAVDDANHNFQHLIEHTILDAVHFGDIHLLASEEAKKTALFGCTDLLLAVGFVRAFLAFLFLLFDFEAMRNNISEAVDYLGNVVLLGNYNNLFFLLDLTVTNVASAVIDVLRDNSAAYFLQMRTGLLVKVK